MVKKDNHPHSMTMTICFLLISIIAFFTNKAKWGKYFTPSLFFVGLWFVIFFLSQLGLFGINKPSDLTTRIIIFGTISFYLGSLLVPRHKQFKHKRNCDITINRPLVYNLFFVLSLFALLVFCLSIIPVIKLIRQGYSLSDIYYFRGIIANGGLTPLNSTMPFLDILLQYIAYPILTISSPVAIYFFLREKKKTLLIMSLITIVLGYIYKANRLDIVVFIIIFLLEYLLFNRKIGVKKIVLYCSLAFALLVAVLLFLTYKRAGSLDSIWRTVYLYLCGNVPFQDIQYQNVTNYTYGLTSFSGALRGFFQFSGLKNAELVQLSYQYADVEERINIGGGNAFNAFVGVFYTFYCDFGFFGVILGSLLFGFAVQYLYKKAYYNKNNPMIVSLYFIFFVRGVCFSFFNFMFVNLSYGNIIWIYSLVCVFLRLLSHKKVRRFTDKHFQELVGG